MQQRTFGKLGYEVSLLGMGCMRLPRMEMPDGSVDIDRERAVELIRYAADNGVNYFDSALTYHNRKSEDVLGEALDGRRSKVKIATKQRFPGENNSKDILRKNLESTLKKLRTDYLDVYLIHNINAGEWQGIRDIGTIEEYEKFRAEGMIKAIGFSFHGDFELFKEVLGSYNWAMCQVQQNLLDAENEVTEEGIVLAGKKGCALVVMEPLRGGGLAGAPGDVLEIYNRSGISRSPAEWAFRHMINKPEVTVVLSGMSTLEQLKENIEIFSKPDALPFCLSEAEVQTLAAAKAAYKNRKTIPCTGCEYCLPCPQGVAIPGIFSRYNDGYMFDNFDNPRRSYMFMKNRKSDASYCVACGDCLKKCPQSIDIVEMLKESHSKLDGWRES